MTDFLSDLVDRAFDRAPLLERRRPSPFERKPGDVRLETHDPEGSLPEIGDEVESVSPLHHTAPTPGQTALRSDQAEAAEQMSSDRRRLGLETIRPNSTVFTESHRQIERPPSELSEVASPLKKERPPAEIKEIHTHLIERIIEKVVVEAPQTAENSARVSPERDGARAVIPPVAPQTIQPRVSRALESDAVIEREPRRDRAKNPEEQVEPVKTIDHRVEPARRDLLSAMSLAPPVARAQPVATPAAPTIQVTISRIEVRATPAPVAPERVAKPSAPRLSLEDYLKSRSGGGR